MDCNDCEQLVSPEEAGGKIIYYNGTDMLVIGVTRNPGGNFELHCKKGGTFAIMVVSPDDQVPICPHGEIKI